MSPVETKKSKAEDEKTDEVKSDEKNNNEKDNDEIEITRETILEHLEELRRRIIPPIVIFILVFLATLPFSKKILWLFLSPFRDIVPDFVFIKPFEAFWVHVKASAYFSAFVAIPVFIWEMWLFVAPALYPHERKLARAIVLGVITLFLIGSAFGYFAVLPFSLRFLINTFSSDALQPFLSISEFFSFALKFSLAFGFAFQTPIVMLAVEKAGLITRDKFKSFRPYAIVGAFVIAAIITPTPDALTQTSLAIPLILLWELGIILTKIF